LDSNCGVVWCLRLAAFVIVVLPLNCLSQTAPTRPVNEILAWISAHLGPVMETYKDGSSAEHVSSITWNNCSLTVKTVTAESMGKTRTETVTLNLQGLRPDKIDTRTERGELVIKTISAVTARYEVDIGADLDHARDYDIDAIYLYVSKNEDTLSRMKHAWHDAIVACGGKEIPENLY